MTKPMLHHAAGHDRGRKASKLRLALNHQTAKLESTPLNSLGTLRLALNHQTAKLGAINWERPYWLRLALNHQTAKLRRPC